MSDFKMWQDRTNGFIDDVQKITGQAYSPELLSKGFCCLGTAANALAQAELPGCAGLDDQADLQRMRDAVFEATLHLHDWHTAALVKES